MADEQQTQEQTTPPTTPDPAQQSTTTTTQVPATTPDPATTPADQPTTETPEPVVALTREDLVLPEGLIVSDEQATALLDLFNDDKLSPKDRANKLVEMHGTLVQSAIQTVGEQMLAEIQKQQTEWETAVKSDPKIGGANLAPNLAKVSKLIDAEGTPELRQALDATGAGSHPEIVKFFIKMADRFAEGAPAGGGNPTTKESTAQRMYPGMNP